MSRAWPQQHSEGTVACHELCLASAVTDRTVTHHELCQVPAGTSSPELPCAARAMGRLHGAPVAASDLGQYTAGTRTKIKPPPGEEKARRAGAMSYAGPQHQGLPWRAHRPPASEKSPYGEREKAGGERKRAQAAAGDYWLSPPSIPAPPSIATEGFAGLKEGALGPAWANSVGEGGRGPHGRRGEGGPRWRQGGGPVDTALPVPPPQALAAAARSSARDRGPLPPRGDRAGTRGGAHRLRRTGLRRLLPARPVTFPRPRRGGV